MIFLSPSWCYDYYIKQGFRHIRINSSILLAFKPDFYYKFPNTFIQKQIFHRQSPNKFSIFCLQKYSIAQQCVII